MPLIASLFLALLASSSGSAEPPVVLYRGGPGDAAFRYWAVEDTFLDSKAPDENYGRDALLTAGPGKTVLIRFGDLERMVPAGKRIAQARIVFRTEIGSDPKLKAASRLLVPWGEGPGRRGLMAKLDRRNTDQGESKPTGPVWSATWRHRRSGPSNPTGWQAAGAVGERDAEPIREARLASTAEEVVIEGLGTTFELLRQHPFANYGIALQFATNVDLASSDAPTGKPRLEIELADAPPASGADLEVEQIDPSVDPPKPGEEVVWTARVRNAGTQPAPAFSFRWSSDGKVLLAGSTTKNLAPGEAHGETIKLAFRLTPGDHRLDPLQFEIVQDRPDASPANDALEIFRTGVRLRPPTAGPDDEAGAVRRGFASFDAYMRWVVRFWNETLLAHSRFSFARDGSKERIRISYSVNGSPHPDPFDLRKLLHDLSVSVGLEDLSDEESWPLTFQGMPFDRTSRSLYPGLMRGGDTRDEGEYVPQLPIPTEPWPDELLDQTPMPATDLYASADLARLDALIDVPVDERQQRPTVWPKTVLVRFLNAAGQALSNTPVEAFGSDGTNLSPVLQLKTSAQGTLVLPDRGGLGWSGVLLWQARLGQTTEYGWLKGSQVLVGAKRSPGAATILDVRIPLPAAPIETLKELARNSLVIDDLGSLPARLAALVDDDPKSVVTLSPETKWIEVDLGRDRPIGEIQLLVHGDTIWPQFDIRVHQTGQRPSEAIRYAAERFGAWSLANRSDADTLGEGLRALSYRGVETKARFIRLVPIGATQPVSLAGIRVHPFAMEAER